MNNRDGKQERREVVSSKTIQKRREGLGGGAMRGLRQLALSCGHTEERPLFLPLPLRVLCGQCQREADNKMKGKK